MAQTSAWVQRLSRLMFRYKCKSFAKKVSREDFSVKSHMHLVCNTTYAGRAENIAFSGASEENVYASTSLGLTRCCMELPLFWQCPISSLSYRLILLPPLLSALDLKEKLLSCQSHFSPILNVTYHPFCLCKYIIHMHIHRLTWMCYICTAVCVHFYVCSFFCVDCRLIVDWLVDWLIDWNGQHWNCLIGNAIKHF